MMIEKLELGCFAKQDANTKFVNLFTVVNQLVDAVNSLRDDCNLLMGYIAPEDKCEPESFVSVDEALNTATAKELDRTRKALDVAVDALYYANKCIKGGCVNWETHIDKALEQINEIIGGKDE